MCWGGGLDEYYPLDLIFCCLLGANMPNKFSSAYTSGTECRIDPGCKFEFVCCLKVYKKIGHTVAVVRASPLSG